MCFIFTQKCNHSTPDNFDVASECELKGLSILTTDGTEPKVLPTISEGIINVLASGIVIGVGVGEVGIVVKIKIILTLVTDSNGLPAILTGRKIQWNADLSVDRFRAAVTPTPDCSDDMIRFVGVLLGVFGYL